MCGFVGIIGAASDEVTDAALDRAADAISHRGPDSVGVHRFAGASLVHARLRVMDLRSIADQPFTTKDGRFQTLYNGEVYNFRNLRDELRRDYSIEFLTDCDTEVVARGFDVWGNSLFGKLQGMFALAVVDLHSKTVTLARDRFGIKPLYYALHRGSIAFASEPAALMQLLPGRPSICRQSLFDFMSLRAVPAPATLFNDIFSVEPGQLLEFEQGPRNSVSKVMFYDHKITIDHELDVISAARQMTDLINRAVLQQTSADVPVGALVSGGLDSSLIALAATTVGRKLPTYSVSFADSEFDESTAALLVSSALGTHHTVMESAPVPLDWARLMDLLGGTGQLCADPSFLPLESISGIMRESLVVGLTGDGGDEGFGGYPHYLYTPRLVKILARLNSRPGQILVAGVKPVIVIIGRVGRLSGKMGRLLDLMSVRTRSEMMAVIYSWIRPREMQSAWIGGSVEPIARHFGQTWSVHADPRNSEKDLLFAHLCELDTRVRMANDYLVKTDIASMRHAFEMRLPLLDEAVFEFASNLPAHLKTSGQKGKIVMRQVVRERLPGIAELPKRGFRVPLRDWLPIDVRRRAVQQLTRTGHILHEVINPRWIEEVMSAFEADRALPGVTRQGVEIRALMLMTLEAQLLCADPEGIR